MKHLFFLLILSAALSAAMPSEAKEAPPPPPREKPPFVLTIESLARGLTFQSVDAKRVSFTVGPNRAFFRISF